MAGLKKISLEIWIKTPIPLSDIDIGVVRQKLAKKSDFGLEICVFEQKTKKNAWKISWIC